MAWTTGFTPPSATAAWTSTWPARSTNSAKGVFRFRPDLSKLELLQNTTNNTWGLGFTEQGDVIGSTANNNPSWILSIPAAAYAGSGIPQPKTPRLDTSVKVDRNAKNPSELKLPKMFTNTKDVTQVDQIDRYTAAAGHQFHTDNLLAGIFSANNAFICEPTGHIVATGELLENGSLKQTVLRGNNAFASADAWAAPVAARVGPDGALWIADWYNPDHPAQRRFPLLQSGARLRPAAQPLSEPAGKRTRQGQCLRNPAARRHPRPDLADRPGQHSRPQGNRHRSLETRHAHRRTFLAIPADPAPVPAPARRARRTGCHPGVGKADHRRRAPLRGHSRDLDAGRPRCRRAAILSALRSSRRIHSSAAMPCSRLARTIQAWSPPCRSFIENADSPRELLYVLTTAALAPQDAAVSAALWKLVSSDKRMDETLQEAARLAMRRQGLTLLGVDLAKLR